jgi:ankyrin repeat protein
MDTVTLKHDPIQDRTPLMQAVERADLSRVEALLKEGVDVDAQTSTGITALHLASSKGYAQIVELLLEYKATVDIPSHRGNTALHAAAWNAHSEVVELLLKAKAKPSCQTSSEETALDFARRGETPQESLEKHRARTKTIESLQTWMLKHSPSSHTALHP